MIPIFSILVKEVKGDLEFFWGRTFLMASGWGSKEFL
jgi:hypothetical protein